MSAVRGCQDRVRPGSDALQKGTPSGHRRGGGGGRYHRDDATEGKAGGARVRCSGGTSDLGAANQGVPGAAGAGALGEGQGVGDQAQAVVTGDAQGQAGLQVHQGLGHLGAVLALGAQGRRRHLTTGSEGTPEDLANDPRGGSEQDEENKYALLSSAFG